MRDDFITGLMFGVLIMVACNAAVWLIPGPAFYDRCEQLLEVDQ